MTTEPLNISEYRLDFISQEDVDNKVDTDGKIKWEQSFDEEVQKTIHERLLEMHEAEYESMIRARIMGEWEYYDAKYDQIQKQFEQMRQMSRERETPGFTAIQYSNLCQEICLPSQTMSRWDVPVTKGPISGIVIGDVL